MISGQITHPLILSYLINTALYLSSFLLQNQNTARPHHDFGQITHPLEKTAQNNLLYIPLR